MAATRKLVKRTKNPIRKSKKRFPFLVVFCLLFSSLLVFGIFHYRNALAYYFSFKSHKQDKIDKVARARIVQILEKHKDYAFGIDVSEYQGNIEWEALDSIEKKYPIHFVFVRATAGKDKIDKKFDTNWRKLGKQKIIRGAYHYYRPNENSIEQATNFIKNVRLKKGDFPPVLDIEQLPREQSMDSLKKGLQRWLDKVEAHYKVRPILYSGEKYYTSFLQKEFKKYTFWVANYNFWVENIKDEWQFWQFTESAVIKGITSKVDVNIYNGTPKMLEYSTISN
jgi:lysozyme